MLQNLEVPLLSCNQKDHQKQYISAICTRKECDKQSALCSRCMFPFHKSCEDHITFLEDLPNKSNKIENEFVEVDHFIESLIKELREVQLMYQQTVKAILEYKAAPNMTNLNNVGTMFRLYELINIDSIRIGTQLIARIIESNLSLFNPKELTPQEQMDAEEQIMKCQQSYNKNEFQKAIEYADRALGVNLRSYNYWLWKGMALNQLYKHEEAIQCLDTALSINPKNDPAWNNKGFALNQLYKYEEAIQCLNTALSINPENDSAWINKGIALNQLYKYEEAIQCLDTALSINPKNDPAWNNKGFALNQLYKHEEAIQCLNTALSINPENDSAWINKGFALNQLNKYEEAIQCYEESLSLKSSFLTYYQKSFPLESLNKLKEAEDCLKQALEFNPNDQFSIIDRLKDIQAKLMI